MTRHDWSIEDYDDYRRKLVRESQKKRREEAKAKGLCPICCKRPARPGKLTCEECNDRAKRYALTRGNKA